MSDSAKKILSTVGIMIITALLTYFGSQYLPGTEEKISKDSTVTTSIRTSIHEKNFNAELKNKLRIELLDSLKSTFKPQLKIVYEAATYNLDSLIAEAKAEALQKIHDSIKTADQKKPIIFTSTADTNYVMKDSLGRTRDSVAVHSEFRSPIPLHSASQHILGLYHKSFSYDSYTEKNINTTHIVTKKTFWDNIQPGLIAAYGYGLKSASWEFFIGAGANLDIQGLIKTLQEK